MTLPFSVTPPNLALAPDKYDRRAEDLAANIHKQFYASVSNAVNFCLLNGVFNESTSGTSGTWIPTVAFGVYPAITSTGQVLIGQTGRYQLFGDHVLATWELIFTNKGISVGAAYMRGLPFPGSNTFGSSIGLSSYAVNMAGLTGPITVDPRTIATTNTDLDMYMWGPTGVSQLSNANFTNTTAFYGGVIYPRA